MTALSNATAFRLARPLRQQTSVIFSSPHSGRDYPQAFLDASPLVPLALRSSEDAYVDRLFARAPLFGAPLLCATAPRAYIDLNRGADELDPAVVADVPRGAHNPRIASGLGVIPRVVAGGRAIYHGKIPRDEAQARIDAHWHPWHKALQGLIDDTHATFGEAILIDCHSMPHEAIAAHMRPGQEPPQVVLGDRFGAAQHAQWWIRWKRSLPRLAFAWRATRPLRGHTFPKPMGTLCQTNTSFRWKSTDLFTWMNARWNRCPTFPPFVSASTAWSANWLR